MIYVFTILQNIIDKYELKLVKTGHFYGYNINKNPNVINSVAHAAMWYTATLIPEVLLVSKEDTIKFAGTFFAPFELYERNGYENVLMGLLQSSTQKDDSVINQVMMNEMFKDATYKGMYR